jgi:hypothetical protein
VLRIATIAVLAALAGACTATAFGRRFAYTDFALNAAGYYVPELYVVTIKTRQARFLTARAGTTVNVRWSSPTTLTYLALGTS